MPRRLPDVFNVVLKTVPAIIIVAETATFTTCYAIKAHISLVTCPQTLLALSFFSSRSSRRVFGDIKLHQVVLESVIVRITCLSSEQQKSGDDKSDTDFEGNVIVKDKGGTPSSSGRNRLSGTAHKDFAEVISW